MMFIQWSDDYVLGVARIDEQHRGLIDRINALYFAIQPQPDNDRLHKMLRGFNRYAEEHFSTEEALAREQGVPALELAAHVAQHREYAARMNDFSERLERNDPHVSILLLAYLHDWWVNHILEVDRVLCEQINRKGTAR
jgi:hemerythrin